MKRAVKRLARGVLIFAGIAPLVCVAYPLVWLGILCDMVLEVILVPPLMWLDDRWKELMRDAGPLQGEREGSDPAGVRDGQRGQAL